MTCKPPRTPRGGRHLIVAEDAHPLPARAIRPVITINLPDLQAEAVWCDEEFTIVSQDQRGLRLSMRLDRDELAISSLRSQT